MSNQFGRVIATLCTSCGQQISSSSKLYKCRQCTNHILCKACSKIDRNTAIAKYHTFDKISESGKMKKELVTATPIVDSQKQYVSYISKINSDISTISFKHVFHFRSVPLFLIAMPI